MSDDEFQEQYDNLSDSISFISDSLVQDSYKVFRLYMAYILTESTSL